MEKNNIPAESRQKAIDYKKNIAGKFMLVEGAKIKSRVDGSDFCVTRKIDGHLQCLFYQDGTAYMLNSGGNQIADDLRCIHAFAEAMQQAGVSSAVVAAELFMPKQGGRPRCADVKRALADPAQRNELRLAPFDILEVNGEPWKVDHYKHTHAQLCKWFQGDDVIPVDMMTAESLEEVQTIYDEWVECQGAEGLVIHSDSHIICKVKPRHTIDAAIVGYTIGDKGVRDLMMAVRREDGLFQVFAVGSGGLSDEARLSLLNRLSQQHVESQYILSDSRGIAYQMVKPESVFELSVIELVAKGNDDKVRTNALLTFDDQQGWIMNGMTPGISAFGLIFEREREDKSPTPSDIRISQLTDLCPF
jgi:ATP-dependent DNA ligase